MTLQADLKKLDWQTICADLSQKGYALIPHFLNLKQCDELIALYPEDKLYRKTINLARYRFGSGEYRYFADPLPAVIQNLRTQIYPYLAPLANEWSEKLRLNIHYPPTLEELSAQCAAAGQIFPTPLILQYGEGGYNCLHQDLYGDIFFPMQALFLLSQYGEDFEGGEFVLTEQIPRAQSRPRVLTPNRGDMVLFTTRYRPQPSKLGHYRVNIRHGVAEISSGTRFTMGVMFHSAAS